MKKQISPRIVSLVFAVMVICFAIAFYALAVWQEPTQPQPGGNVPPPLNTSSEAQWKIAGLLLNTGGYPNGLIVDKGNVGIGTPSPSEKLDVVGNIVASGTICDSTGCIGAGGGGGFGAWETKSVGTVYQAATNGFVVAYFTGGTSGYIEGYTDGSNPPTIMRLSNRFLRTHSDSGFFQSGSITMPVRKGDYWKVTKGGGAAAATVYWIPLGN